MTKARDIADFKFENITDTGTEGTKVALGTTAQRGSTQGQIRFNTTNNLAEYYDGSSFKSIDAPPTISSLDVTEVDSQAGGNQTIVITGSGFASGATVTYIGNAGTDFNASTVTVDSNTQITAVAPKASFLNAQEPYGVKVSNVSGLSATLASQINVDTSPSWSTSSGTIATIDEDATGTHATVSATDADGDTVAYSVQSGSIPAGTSLNSSTGAISGDPTDVGSSTTSTFTLRATANSKTVDRSFNIIVNPTPTGGNLIAEYTYSGTTYRIHKFTSTGNFVLGGSKTVDYLIIGGGGGGGHHSGGGGGAGGLVWFTGQSLSAGTYQAVVGTGGATNYNSNGTNGVSSSFNSHIGLYGGGGGNGGGASAGNNGGSGGGGARANAAAGSSIQNSTYGYGFGHNGASSGSNNGSPNYAGYAGGGSGSAGSNRIGGNGKSDFVDATTAATTAFLLGSVAGTDGSNVATTGSSSGTLYIGGGGGGSDQDNATNTDLNGGVGGGGNGSDSAGYSGTTAIANTGSGAGGQGWNNGTVANTASGATGIVIVRYAI